MASSLTPEPREPVEGPELRPLTELLAAVAAELNDLAALSDRLQPFISSALMADGATDADHLREFQALDLLVQRLNGVAAFVTALAQSMPKDWRIDTEDAASHVVLADLARRLGAHTADVRPLPQSDASASGDLELFG